ncbi:hypothetical protein D3C85_1260070 [compost metagenome]
MVQQRVAAGEQEAVRPRALQVEQQLNGLDPVHAQSPGADHAFVTQPVQRLEGPLACGLEHAEPLVTVEVLRNIVHPHDVEPVGLQALQAVLDRAQRRRLGVVVDDPVGAAVPEHVALLAQVTGGDVLHLVQDQAPDLGGQHDAVAVAAGQRVAQARFRQAGAVERRGVEEADAVLPGGIDGRLRLGFGNGAEHVAQRCGAEAQVAGDEVLEGHGALRFGGGMSE